MLTISDLVIHNARNNPNGCAFIVEGERYSWSDMNDSINRLANSLMELGVSKNDRVVFLLPNGLEIVQVYYALAKIGAIAVPMAFHSVAREIVHIVSDTEANVIIGGMHSQGAISEALSTALVEKDMTVIGVGVDHNFKYDFHSLIVSSVSSEPKVSVTEDDIYAIQFTSGTTGAPKGCVLRHGAKVSGRFSAVAQTPMQVGDKGLIFLPLFASLGADLLHANVLAGIPTVLMAKYDVESFLTLVQNERVTHVSVVETTFDRLIGFPRLAEFDLSSLKWFQAVSTTRDPRPGMQALTNLPTFSAKFWNSYGCTEGGGWMTFLPPQVMNLNDPDDSRIRSIGQEAKCCRIECVDENGTEVEAGVIGEMVMSAPWLFSEYWRQPENTAASLKDGRYFTGDLARKDSDGFIYLEGRKKDMIKSGGLNVYPAEIEQVLKQHHAVKEVAVVGVSDPEWGEKVVACVIKQAPVSEEELDTLCKKELANYKRPKAFVFLDDFPRDNAAGKIIKRKLRDQIENA